MSRRGRLRRRRQTRSSGSPPVRNERRSVRRRSGVPPRAGSRRLVRRRGTDRSIRAISSASAASSSREQREKLFSFRSSVALASPTSASACTSTLIRMGGSGVRLRRPEEGGEERVVDLDLLGPGEQRGPPGPVELARRQERAGAGEGGDPVGPDGQPGRAQRLPEADDGLDGFGAHGVSVAACGRFPRS